MSMFGLCCSCGIVRMWYCLLGCPLRMLLHLEYVEGTVAIKVGLHINAYVLGIVCSIFKNMYGIPQ
jgi:hypothetical protein